MLRNPLLEQIKSNIFNTVFNEKKRDKIRISRCSCRLMFVFLGGAVCLMRSVSAEALLNIDQLEGTDQSFKAGYTLRGDSETFHQTQVREFVTEGESAIYTEEEAEHLEEDLWQYSRQISGGVLYNTNAKGLSHDPTGDLIYTLKPEVGMFRKKDYTSVSLAYGLTSVRNAQNEEAATISHDASADITFDFGRLNLGLSESFSPRSIYDQGERTDLASEKQGQKKVAAFTNGLSLSSDYEFSEKTSVSFRYDNRLLYFPIKKDVTSTIQNNALSAMTHTYSPGITYALNSRVSLHGEYEKEIIDYFKGGAFGSKAQTIRLGGNTTLRRNIKVTGSVAYFIREYFDFGKPSSIGFLYDLTVARPLTKKMTATVSVKNAIGENLDLTKSPSLKTDTTFYHLICSYALTKRITLEGSASLTFFERAGFVSAKDEENEALTFTRPDETDTYLLGLSLTWTPRKFFSMLAGYDMQNQKGPFKKDDITTHRFAVSGTFLF